jgi:hypothetical protein
VELDPSLVSEQLEKDAKIVRGLVQNWSTEYGFGKLTLELVRRQFSNRHTPEELSHLEKIFSEEMGKKSATATQ